MYGMNRVFPGFENNYRVRINFEYEIGCEDKNTALNFISEEIKDYLNAGGPIEDIADIEVESNISRF